jgi:hypothetical protein
MVIPTTLDLSKVQAAEVKVFQYDVTPNLKSITLSWKKQSNVSYYKILRVNSTKYYSTGSSPRKKEYKEIATVSENTTEYVDKTVKKSTRYCYIINGYKKKDGKDKLLCTTYPDDTFYCYTSGLAKPEFSYSNFIEDYSFTLNKIFFSVNQGGGMKPTGYIIYRKKVGEKKYKKVKLKKLAEGEYVDKKVAAGSYYKYKVKSYLKIGTKTYYSKMSAAFTGNTIRYVGKYKVKMMTQKGIDTSTLSFKVVSKNKYNGSTRFLSGGAFYFYQSSKTTEKKRYDFKLTKYSFDNKTWKKIPKKGVLLKVKQKIYLQGTLYEDSLTEPATINFEESKPYKSYLSFGDSDFGDAIEYKNSKYYAEAIFDFVKGKGEAHQEGD